MNELLLKLSPVFLFFGLGVFLKRIRFATTDHADFLLRLVFFVTLPALVLLQLSRMSITWDKIYLPFINIIINLCCMGASLMLFKVMQAPRKTKGTILVSTMIANNVFMFPFIMAGFGNSGFADAVLFDFGNGLTTATITYLMAFKYGEQSADATAMMAKLIRSPLFWAFVIAIFLSLFSMTLPLCLGPFLEGVGQMTSPLILMSLGIYFHPQFSDLKLVSVTVLIRSGLGLAVGAALATVLNLSDQTFAVVILCSAAPVGFMALTFSSIAQLDKAFASKVVSISILLGLIYIPVLILLLGD